MPSSSYSMTSCSHDLAEGKNNTIGPIYPGNVSRPNQAGQNPSARLGYAWSARAFAEHNSMSSTAMCYVPSQSTAKQGKPVSQTYDCFARAPHAASLHKEGGGYLLTARKLQRYCVSKTCNCKLQ